MLGQIITILAFAPPDWQLIAAVLLLMVCVGFASWAIVARRVPTETEIDRRLQGLVGDRGRQAQAAEGGVVRERANSALFSKFAVFGKPLEAESDYARNRLALRLTQAGIRNESAVAIFLSMKMLLMFVGAALGFSVGWARHITGVNLMCAVAVGAVLGFYIPDLWLSRRARERSRRIELALPDSLDMLVISVEAGLGLDAAIQRVGDEMSRTYPALAEEWTIAARENQMGIPRAEAMRKMAERTNCPDMHALVAVLMQAERLGTSVARTLRVHAETMRVKRRQRAEERAAKTSVKLLFPLIFFLFPTIFVVILGPAVINALRLWPNGR